MKQTHKLLDRSYTILESNKILHIVKYTNNSMSIWTGNSGYYASNIGANTCIILPCHPDDIAANIDEFAKVNNNIGITSIYDLQLVRWEYV